MRPFHVEIPDLAAVLVGLVRQVPPGHVTTYGDLANALGDSRAAIWVATLLANPPPPLEGVSHRVVRASGETSKHVLNAGERLADEGVPFNGLLADLSHARFQQFQSDRPLQRLQRHQEQLAQRVRLTPLDMRPMMVGAIDVSYRSDGVAVAAYVLMDADSAEPVWTWTESVPVNFPYIQGYLAYRELPIYEVLLRKVANEGRIAPLVFVDGNGILHPRRSGIATQLGVLADHPTVGVSKSLHCGTVVFDGTFGPGTGRVVHQGETIAAALPPSSRGKKPIYISPGNLCTLEDAVAVATAWRRDLRLPEPIRRADALSRAVAKDGLEAV